MNTRTALFPGTFNPFTTGHKSIADRALKLFDRLVIIVGCNIGKEESDDTAQRVEAIRQVFAGNDAVTVEAFSGLTVDACRHYDVCCIVRGVRSVADFEYERNLADVNREIAGVETVLLAAEPGMAIVSSSMVRELKAFGADVSKFIP